jgi:hypothetical protein
VVESGPRQEEASCLSGCPILLKKRAIKRLRVRLTLHIIIMLPIKP